jgi:hypothetical protein
MTLLLFLNGFNLLAGVHPMMRLRMIFSQDSVNLNVDHEAVHIDVHDVDHDVECNVNHNTVRNTVHDAIGVGSRRSRPWQTACFAWITVISSTFGFIAPSQSQTSDLPPPPAPTIGVPASAGSAASAITPLVPTVLTPTGANPALYNSGILPVTTVPSLLTSSMVSGFRVVIPNNDPNVLAQVKQIEPQAFMHTIGDVQFIQLGAYRTEAAARQRADALALQGIGTEIHSFGGSIAGTSSYNPRQSPRSPGVNSQSLDRGYYVIIPMTAAEVNTLRRQLINLGVPTQNLVLRDQPHGLHFAIGIYREAGAAKTMNSYLLERGVRNARVYLQR